MENPLLIRQLQSALSRALPGSAVQNKMAHLERREALARPVRSDVRNAAVLVLLFQLTDIWHTVLIRRKAIDGDVHAGQISLPGGRLQADETPEMGAKREAHEEIGCTPDQILTLGRLTELHIPVSNHMVFPIVGYLDSYTGWTAQDSEVDEIFELPLAHLQAPDAMERVSIRLNTGLTLRDVPSYRFQGQIIWGATAMILSELSALLDRMSL